MKLKIRFLIVPTLALMLLLFAAIVRADTVHVIQPGDSLYRISLQYGVTIDAIVQANNIVNPNLIVAGHELIIPGVDGPATGQPLPAATATPSPTTPTTLPAHAIVVEDGVLHTVQKGDSLFRLSLAYNVAIADIVAANNITNAGLIFAGQELLIPGVSGLASSLPAATTPPTSATTAPQATAAPPTLPTADPNVTNLFKNGNFEGDWYFYLYNELQVPTGWQLATDEGPNTLNPGSGGNFNRPEVRVVGKNQLPETEWAWFIPEGYKSVKVFKGGAPTSFSLFQDVYLQPGSYRMTLNFFPDIVAQYYPGGTRDFNTDPLSGEVRVIHNDGGTEWTTVTAGQPNSRVYEFNVAQAGGVRLGASFRNRFETANNGWFLDNWKLERIR
ncbi:putative Lysozyme [Candidatus Promineifilum breve]|uniref:Lysozyme n=1 Tax=Candidatus Promineifilum breve TaxID=1806508 RepID=A0A160T9B3_9CHLR|nr:LysM domain-containing protein [Candidatus Promineifilum breve]CUS06058.1 putative Lysozyme [Candidatus Promineifilum breve]